MNAAPVRELIFCSLVWTALAGISCGGSAGSQTPVDAHISFDENLPSDGGANPCGCATGQLCVQVCDCCGIATGDRDAQPAAQSHYTCVADTGQCASGAPGTSFTVAGRSCECTGIASEPAQCPCE